MLLTLTSTTAPARDLGYLLKKHPDRLASFSLPFGTAHVFYPEAADDRCTAAREYNVLFPALGEARLRHTDHRFEWTREGLRTWSERIAAQFGYSVDFKPIGDEDAIHGAPTQMAVFRCA
jgi:hypothetical protein